MGIAALAAALLAAGCGDREASRPQAADTGTDVAARIAAEFGVQQAVRINFQAATPEMRAQCKKAGGSGAVCFTYEIRLDNPGAAIGADQRDWAIYFHSIRRTFAVLNNPGFDVTNINGDLYRLSPNASFEGIPEGELVLEMLGENWMQFESDFMPRFFVVGADGEAHVIASTDTDDIDQLILPITHYDPQNWMRTGADENILATAESRFERYAQVAPAAADSTARLIPQAWRQQQLADAPVDVAGGITLQVSGLPQAATQAIEARLNLLGLAGDAYPITIKVAPEELPDAAQRSGGYELVTGADGAQAVAFDEAGAFYAAQSLIGLLDAQGKALPQVEIVDFPRFDYRGFNIDLGRNFHTKTMLLKLIDQMAAYKLNKLHLHLSDDEGWRIEIPGLPELTEVGSKRCFDLEENRCLLPQLGSGPDSNNNGSGFLSTDDYRELVAYADARFIQVIPEIDMPAHARAAVVSMEARYRKLLEQDRAAAEEFRLIDPQDTTRFRSVQFYTDSYLNPCIASSYRFVDKVISEIQSMHEQAGQPLQAWHFGGDEAVNIYASASFEDAPGEDPNKGDIDASYRKQPWSESPACQKMIDAGDIASTDDLPRHFAQRVSELVAARGIDTMMAWHDGLKRVESPEAELATPNNLVNAWAPLMWGGGEEGLHMAEKGFSMVQSHSDFLYFDMPYEVDPKESGYYWAARYTDTRKTFSYAPLNTPQMAEVSRNRDGGTWQANSDQPAAAIEKIVGMQGQLWSEVVRTDARAEYMVFPRLLALAERAWHRAPWELDYVQGRSFSASTEFVDRAALEKDWQSFASALAKRELYKLDLAGVAYRVPVPGARIEDGAVRINAPWPGLRLQYLNGDGNWHDYSSDNPPQTAQAVRALSADGDRAGRDIPL
ncbi:beta-N-acetylhexosaminidase [Biformimicrobium ophioploci]|uniref:beta-N-acetylhexosaminidase n=2 Tax=Biformimicrobium ophioploci TaxID=3036711 RepID=A0ABQ6LXC7_9GAMM|nr:beta-N-acetylhexosaminidase [Microbulbifer sp. NKW57]